MRERVYFMHCRPARLGGHACQQHRVFGATYAPVAEGYLHRTFRPSPITFASDGGEPSILVRLRKSFPLTGKIDIRDARTSVLLGVATRGYRLYDANEQLVAQLSDAVPLGARAKRALGEAALDLAFGSGGDVGGSSPAEFVLLGSGRRLGRLRRLTLPFFPDPPPPRSGRAQLVDVLPAGVRRWLDAPPGGWTLEIDDASVAPSEPLLLSFCMMSLELAAWSG